MDRPDRDRPAAQLLPDGAHPDRADRRRAEVDRRGADLTDRGCAESDYPAEPYPGARPAFSFVHVGHRIHQFDAARDGALAGHRHVLAYGSNACPAKIGWLRTALGLTGPVVVRRATCTGMAAVWAAGRRIVDDQRPATLVAAPGVAEEHAVWLATDEQLRVLDRCEGRGERYRLVRLHTGRVTLDDGTPIRDVLAYTGLAPRRMPLLVDGVPKRCADVSQAEAMLLRGAPASSDGLDVTEVPMPVPP